MSAPDLPPGLVEAVAEAMWASAIEHDADSDATPWEQAQPWDRDWTLMQARATVTAMVEHLGLVEEWQTRAGSRGLEWFEIHRDYAQWAMSRDRDEYPLRHRLVQSRWTEVDHGSE